MRGEGAGTGASEMNLEIILLVLILMALCISPGFVNGAFAMLIAGAVGLGILMLLVWAVMDAVALFAKENNMYKESLSELVEKAYFKGVADYVAVLKNFYVKPHPEMALSIAEAKIKEQVK